MASTRMTSGLKIRSALLLSAAVSVAICCLQPVRFRRVNSTACIRDQFVQTYPWISDMRCSLTCAADPRCQAWTQKTATGAASCKIFVFDKCSKGVRNCNCTAAVQQLFVRQQAGLSPGQLCPSNYTAAAAASFPSLCDVRYQLFDNSGNWYLGKQKCDSEPGLTIMADVTSSAENNYVFSIRQSSDKPFFLSGVQDPGSSETGTNNYTWKSCNIKLDSAFWGSGQPNNNAANGENVTGTWHAVGVIDTADIGTDMQGVLCECLSPF